jgi:serine/threonine protein kinase
MADVYEAHDARLGRIGAIKVLAPAFSRGRSFVERFSRRLRVAGHLS